MLHYKYTLYREREIFKYLKFGLDLINHTLCYEQLCYSKQYLDDLNCLGKQFCDHLLTNCCLQNSKIKLCPFTVRSLAATAGGSANERSERGHSAFL